MEHERILSVYECLCRYTDKSKGIPLKEIKRYIASAGNLKNVSDLTVRRDIERLITMGHDICIDYREHNTAYYRLIKQRLSFNEIRFIVDSVSINKFLSDSQKCKLIRKFEGMCSDAELRRLTGRIPINPENVFSSELMENLEKIHCIIEKSQKINFDYGRFNIQKKMVYYRKSRNIIPVKVIYFSTRFYLKCLDMESHKFRTYRIDRMKNIMGGKTVKHDFPDRTDSDGVVLDMFEPEYFEFVTLHVKRFLMDDMIEWLGSDVNIREDFEDEECIFINARIGISKGFYRWAMKYGSDIEIVSPLSVRDDFSKAIKKISKVYE
ncbi:MAG: WYL domain-containing protein [Ruminococcus sp.]|nr:WYL domain-containing protein [Ruminococcus sp.]MDE6848678.1 WYL domain-containing protein [Ruminococcus sp.]